MLAANLVPAQLVNWNDEIPIGITQLPGTADHTFEGPYFDDDRLYYNIFPFNSGSSDSGSHVVRREIYTYPSNNRLINANRFPATPDGEGFHFTNDISPILSSLPAGAATFKLWVDFDDEVQESNEFDNYYERTITVLPAGTPSAEALAPEAFGLSEGVSFVREHGEITDFGAEKSYSIDLVQGQRISALVQTADGGGIGYEILPGTAIPDDGSVVTSTIPVPDARTIQDVDVVVNIEHRNLEDLDLELVAPDGTVVELSTDNGGDENNYYQTVFDDEGPVSIDGFSATAPFAWRHVPESPLSVLDGMSAAGDWQLRVRDDSPTSAAPGVLHSWAIQFNRGLNSSLTITGPNGQLASNENPAVPGAVDPGVDGLVVPVTGTYEFHVGNDNKNIGAYTLEVGIVAPNVPAETGPITNLDPLKLPNGNVVVLGSGDGIGQSDEYTITLEANQAVTVGASTLGGFYAPQLSVTGPNGFNAADFNSGPPFDSVTRFFATEPGTYTISVDYPFDQEFTNGLSTGNYVVSVITTDDSSNDSIADARPISTIDYRDQETTVSPIIGLTGDVGTWIGSIEDALDTDYFHLGHFEPGDHFRVTTRRIDDSELFSKILLANSAGEVLAIGNTIRSGPDIGATSIEATVTLEDDLYLVVVPDTTEANGDTTSVGEYFLFFAEYDTSEDSYEDNDSKLQVDALIAGAADSANLGVVADVAVIPDLAMIEDTEDWFRFETTVTGNRSDYVKIDFSHEIGNLNLELFDSDGEVVRRSQSFTDDELVSLQGLAAGVYYARVLGFDGARNARYDLRVQSGSPDFQPLSDPFTTDELYTQRYLLNGLEASTQVTLAPGLNTLVVSPAGTSAQPFELLFDVTRVGSMLDQTQVEYDLNGNPSRQTDALGRETFLTADPLGRITRVNGPGSADATNFEYDGNNNVVRMSGSTTGVDQETQYVYDPLDRLTEIILPDSLGSIGYSYDAGSSRITETRYPDGSSVQKTYDSAGRLATVTDGDDVTSYAYYADGLLHTSTLPNGIVSTYAYDAYARLTDLEHLNSAGLLVSSFHYAHDRNGNRTSMEVRRPDPANPTLAVSSLYSYTYDAFQRLESAEYPDGVVVAYTYDLVGNRLSTSTDPDGSGPIASEIENYEYGVENRLLRITDGTGTSLKEFSYDPLGNMVQLVEPTGTTRYEYDYRNLLIQVETPTDLIVYEYDGNGERTARIQNGDRTTFVNDPTESHTQVIAELDDSGLLKSRYTYGLSRISALLPEMAESSFYVPDGGGSVVDLTDGSGIPIQSYSYDAFGLFRSNDEDAAERVTANPFGFQGEAFESELGLNFHRARYYMPEIGRWTTKDPIGFGDGLNIYEYVGSNPINFVDPSGLEAEGVFFGLATRVATPSFTARGEPIGREAFVGVGVDVTPVNAPQILQDAEFGGPLSPVLGPLLALSRQFVDNGRLITSVGPASGAEFAPLDFVAGYAPGGIDSLAGRSVNVNVSTPYRIGGTASFAGTENGPRFISASGSFSIGPSFGPGSISFPTTTISPPRGGVLLNRAVDFVGNFAHVTGVTVDEITGDIVLIGESDTTGTIPDLRVDDFVTAVRAVFSSAEFPGVTIDPPPGNSQNASVPQIVQLFAGLEDTDVGWVLLEADRVMKTLAAEEDNVSGAPVSSSVAGYRSMLQRWVDARSSGGSSRFWFVPSEMKLVQSADGESFVFDRTAVRLMTEDSLVGNGAVNPEAQSFADWFTTNYDAIAQEEYTVYDYPNDTVGGEQPSQVRIFERLKQVAEAIAFARFLHDNDIPIDFSWINKYEVPFRNTPTEAKTVQNSRSYQANRFVTTTITVTGGVTLETPNAYLTDTTGTANSLAEDALAARPNEESQQWMVGDQQAVSLSLGTSHVDGVESRADLDLLYQTAGTIPFALQRFYSSQDPTSGPFGFGWQFVPAEMDFTRPAFYSSPRSPHTFLNGLHEGEIRVNDFLTGETLTFVSSFNATLTEDAFSWGGLTGDGVPVFTQGGSEQPDGSTLTQDPSSQGYLLVRPSGHQMRFDSDGRLLEMLDERGRPVTYGYTGDSVTSITDPAGQTISLTYDEQRRVQRADGLGGESVLYSYSATGDLETATRSRQGEQITFTYEYDSDHRITKVTMPDMVVESTSIADVLGRVDTSGDARGNEFNRTFDRASRTTVTTDMTDGMTVVQQTDSLGRPVSVTNQLGQTTRYEYKGTNRQPTVVHLPDASRPPLRFEYDAFGNVIRAEDIARGGDANGDGVDDNPMLFEYDANNNLTKVTDARGLVTRYTFNAFNQQTSITRAAETAFAATATFEYDASTGFLVRQTDFSGVTIDLEYDSLGNLTRETTASGTADEIVVEHAYDAFSRRISTEDAAGRITRYTYDGRDQLLTTTLVGPTDFVATNTFDSQTGQRIAETDFVGNLTEFTYEAATGDLVQSTQNGAETGIEYNRFGDIERLVDPEGNITLFLYDDLQRLVDTVSLGSTPRVFDASGTPMGIELMFSQAIDSDAIDNGTDAVVTNVGGQVIAGSLAFSSDNDQLTWTPSVSPLPQDTYTITLLADGVGEFAAVDGTLLDGEYFGRLPSGDNSPGGDFVFDWVVDDHGNDLENATLVMAPTVAAGELEFPGDADWFQFDATEGNRYRFETALDTLTNSVLRLYDQNGALMELNDDIDAATTQFDSRIDWQAPSDGTYYLSVRGFADQRDGRYQLSIESLIDDHSDDPAESTVIAVPSLVLGHLEVPTDSDRFKFTATAGTEYRITTLLGSLEDSIATVFDTDGVTALAQNDNFFVGNNGSFLYWTAPTNGDYFVSVGSPGGQYDGTYELTISVDDHGDYSVPASFIGVGAPIIGDLEVNGDSDWFQFDAVDGQDYRFETVLGSLPDSILRLYDSDGETFLVGNDNYDGKESRFYWQAPRNDSFFLRVDGVDFPGTYTLEATPLSDDHVDVGPGSTPVLFDSTTDGDLELPADRDWFQFTAVAGAKYRFETQLDDLADSILRLYAPDGSSILTENDDFDGLASRIDWLASEAGTYFVEVLSRDETRTGTYSLLATRLEQIPPQGRVVFPIPGTVVSTDPGYIDVEWSDVGSGIDESTIDPSDLDIPEVEVTHVTSQGSGIWRYHYSGELPGDEVNVEILDTHVADLHGNWNPDITAPLVDQVIIDDGTGQSSSVRSITVEFNSMVSADDGAFEVTAHDGTQVDVTAVLETVAGKTIAILSFSGARVDSSGSLIDGNYSLKILDTHVRDLAGNMLDGDADGAAGASHVDDFFRLYGDADGDGDVDLDDLFDAFSPALFSIRGDANYSRSLDADDDGDIDLNDFNDHFVPNLFKVRS